VKLKNYTMAIKLHFNEATKGTTAINDNLIMYLSNGGEPSSDD